MRCSIRRRRAINIRLLHLNAREWCTRGVAPAVVVIAYGGWVSLSDTQNARGSLWHRWDPHIHTPGTLLADNFGKDAWESYLTAIETAQPALRALGVTDYYSVASYEAVVAHKKAGRLPKVELVFLNVEMRFSIGTGKSHPINFHLLVSPEDGDHVEQTMRFMRRLTFRAHEELFTCDRSDLIRLGRLHLKNSKIDERAALQAGANQFKVDLAGLRDAFEKSEWARKNILVAVASAEGDGTAGLQDDSSLATVRREIEKFADVILGSSTLDSGLLAWPRRGHT